MKKIGSHATMVFLTKPLNMNGDYQSSKNSMVFEADGGKKK